MPSGDRRFLHGKYLICSVLCDIGCGLRLGVPDAGVSACRRVFPPAGAGGRPDPPAFGSSCGRKEKAVGRAVRFEGFRSVADLVRLRTVPGRRIAVVRSGESERKDSVGTRRYGATCGHGTAFSHDGFGFRPKERTPWNMRSCIERRQFRTWPPGMAAYRRIGSPRICVWENRDRGGRLFILLKKRRI